MILPKRISPSKPSAGSIAPWRVAVNAAICLFLVATGRANAHPEFNAVTTNRYVKIDLLSGEELRLAYTIMYGAGPAYAERKSADTNGDGRLDEAETRALGEKVRAFAQKSLKLTVDGQAVAPELEAATVGLAGPEVAQSPFSVDLQARIRCPGRGPHLIVLDDALEPPQLGETEIRIEESPSTRLLEAHRGPGPGPRENSILFRGPRFSALEDRSVTVRFEGTSAASAQTKGAARGAGRAALVGIVGLAGVALLAIALFARRYRNMKG
jgi:hypothetical protein